MEANLDDTKVAELDRDGARMTYGKRPFALSHCGVRGARPCRATRYLSRGGGHRVRGKPICIEQHNVHCVVMSMDKLELAHTLERHPSPIPLPVIQAHARIHVQPTQLALRVTHGEGRRVRGVAVLDPAREDVLYHHRGASAEGELALQDEVTTIDLHQSGNAWFSSFYGAIRLGGHQAVVFNEAHGGFWMVTDYESVAQVARDNETFAHKYELGAPDGIDYHGICGVPRNPTAPRQPALLLYSPSSRHLFL